MKETLQHASIAAAAAIMSREGEAIAQALGCDPGDPAQGLAKLAQSVHLQSVVQDLQAGRPMEIDALFRVPLDLAAMVDVPTPTLGLMTELATQRARAAGLYKDTAA
jgi:2-dehydropantoate 2-reductase